jgi:hypothetical protein
VLLESRYDMLRKRVPSDDKFQMIWKGHKMPKTKFLWWKFIAIWVCFLLLHFSYETFPSLFFRILAEANETVFLHMKMLFVSYSLVSLAEFAFRRTLIKTASTFLASRALIAIAYPWLAIMFWFLAWAFNVQLPLFWELIYSNIMTLLGIYLALRMEESFDEKEFRPALKWMILLLFVIVVIVYVYF